MFNDTTPGYGLKSYLVVITIICYLSKLLTKFKFDLHIPRPNKVVSTWFLCGNEKSTFSFKQHFSFLSGDSSNPHHCLHVSYLPYTQN